MMASTARFLRDGASHARSADASQCRHAGHWRRTHFLTAVAALVAGAQTAKAQELPRVEPPCSYDVQIIDAPLMPNGFTASLYPYCINNLGEIGGQASPGLATLPMTWSPEKGFAWVPLPPGVGEGRVFGINDNGWLIIQSHVSPGGDRGFIVPAEGRETAQWIPIPPQGATGYSQVCGINNSNEVVGHRTSASAPPGQIQPYVGFVWSPQEGFTDVSIDAAGNPSSGLLRSNDAGTMLGWSSLTGFATFNTVTHVIEDRDVVTLDSEVEGGGMLPGDLAADGSCVVVERVMANAPLGVYAILYSYVVRNGIVECELPVQPPYISALATGVNSAGVAVGDSRNTDGQGSSTPLGMVWFDGVPYTANELAGIPSGSPLYISTVVEINEKGQMVGRIPAGGKIVLMTPSGRVGDLDCDGAVGAADLAIFLGAWGREGTRADLDASGIVDGADLGMLLAEWD